MSHPLVTIHASDWAKILKYFKDTIALISLYDCKTDSEVEQYIQQYVIAIEGNRDSIFMNTALGIVQYLNFYKVLPTEGVHDEFKGIYFTGMAVSEHLTLLGLADLNKLHQRAMLRLLNFRLHEPFKADRAALTERIQSVIDNNKINEHLGKYGWYLIYKCLYNAANTKSKTI